MSSDHDSGFSLCDVSEITHLLDINVDKPGIAAVPDEDCSLPVLALSEIARRLVRSPKCSINALISLVSFADVCNEWRRAAGSLDADVRICYGLDPEIGGNFVSRNSKGQAALLRRLSTEGQERYFLRAARLLGGYGYVTFQGRAGVGEKLVHAVADRCFRQLREVRLERAEAVGDGALCHVACTCSQLEELRVVRCARVTGSFLAALLDPGCPSHASLRRLHLEGLPSFQPHSVNACEGGRACVCSSGIESVHLEDLAGETRADTAPCAGLLSRLPNLRALEICGCRGDLESAAMHCPRLQHVLLIGSSEQALDDQLPALSLIPGLTRLDICVRNFTITPSQLQTVGRLPLEEIRLASQAAHPNLQLPALEDAGVSALIDSILQRWPCEQQPWQQLQQQKPPQLPLQQQEVTPAAGPQTLSLALPGAHSLTHDAASALLRLPLLTGLDIQGCCRINAMDRMRLLAKVKAGRERCGGKLGRRATRPRSPVQA